MFEFITTEDEDRGQVGIGTLIVFIAMVLVAAIAAGVLINTAGFLQNSAEQTGEDSSSQVTDRVQVVHAAGVNEADPAGAIEEAQLTVTKSPGADTIDLQEVTIEAVGPDGSATLQHSTDDDPSQNNFVTGAIGDANENLLSDSSDQHTVRISLTQIGATTSDTGVADDGGLSGGESVTLRITTSSGGTTTEILSAPDSVSGQTAVSL